MGDTVRRKNMWNNAASDNIKHMGGTNHENLDEAFSIWIGQLCVTYGATADKVTVARAKVIVIITALNVLLKCSYFVINTFLSL